MPPRTWWDGAPEGTGKLEVIWEETRILLELTNHMCPPSIRISRIALSLPAMYKGQLRAVVNKRTKPSTYPKAYIISTEMNKSSKTAPVSQGRIEWKAVGRRIRELRGFDLTQKEFAHRIGVSQGYLSYVERGEKEIGAEVLLRISRESGKSIEWLLTGK
jgi:DNA-binding transcriptional regulator YiaG